jgi:hypothetical protein
MSKFHQAHAEIRLFIPLDSESWKAFQKSELGKVLSRYGALKLLTGEKPKNSKKGGKTNAKS